MVIDATNVVLPPDATIRTTAWGSVGGHYRYTEATGTELRIVYLSCRCMKGMVLKERIDEVPCPVCGEFIEPKE